MRQSETFQTVLFSCETNDKIGTKRPRLSIIEPWHYLAGGNLYEMLVLGLGKRQRGTLPPGLITKDQEPTLVPAGNMSCDKWLSERRLESS